MMNSNKTRFSLLVNFIYIMGVLSLVVFTIARACMGIGLADEPFYVSQAYTQIKGNLPIAYDNFAWYFGGSFLLEPLLAIYEKIVPSMEGMYLFSRISYIIFKLVVLGMIFRIISRKLSICSSLVVIAPMILPSHSKGVQMFSYNHSSIVLSMLCSFLVYDLLERKQSKLEIKWLFTGFLLGILVFSHPLYATQVLLTLIFMLVYVKENKWKSIVGLIAGGLLEIILVCIPVIARAGIRQFGKGFNDLLFRGYPSDDSYQFTKSTIGEVVKAYLDSAFSLELLVFVLLGVVLYFFCKLYIRENESKLCENDYRLFSLAVTWSAITLYLTVKMGRTYIMHNMGVWFCMLAIMMICLVRPIRWDIIWFMIIPIAMCIAMIVGVADENPVRMSFAMPILFAIQLRFQESKSGLVNKAGVILTICVCIGCMWHSIKVIDKDEYLSKLTTKVESGVFKGIYTTPERASVFPELERFINENVDVGENYAIRDCVPFAYLFVRNGKPIEWTTWDGMLYHSKINDPSRTYEYYRDRDEIPDKIIYVDIGRDEMLSIENVSFKYNEWMSEYYDLYAEKSFGQINDQRNEMVEARVLVYKYNGKFDGDYQKWIGEASK